MIIKIKKEVEEEFEITGPFKDDGSYPKYFLLVNEKTLITIIKPGDNIFLHKIVPSQCDLDKFGTYQKVSMEEFTQFLCEGLDEFADAIEQLKPTKTIQS